MYCTGFTIISTTYVSKAHKQINVLSPRQTDGRGRAQKPATPPPKPPVGKEVLRTAAELGG